MKLTEDQKMAVHNAAKRRMVRIQGKEWHTLDGLKAAARIAGMSRLEITFEKDTQAEVRVNARCYFGEFFFDGKGIADEAVLYVRESKGSSNFIKLEQGSRTAKNLSQVANARAISQAIRTGLGDIIEGYTVDEMWDDDDPEPAPKPRQQEKPQAKQGINPLLAAMSKNKEMMISRGATAVEASEAILEKVKSYLAGYQIVFKSPADVSKIGPEIMASIKAAIESADAENTFPWSDQ